MISLLIYAALYLIGSMYSAQLSAVFVTALFSMNVYFSALDEVGGRVERPFGDRTNPGDPTRGKSKEK